MRITIADVARRARVSTATVSRALNGKGSIDVDTRARVEAAMKELNYTPNLTARHLGQGKGYMIGLVLPDIANPFFPLVARGAGDVATQHGYTLVLANSDGNEQTEADALRALLGRRVDGILLAPAAAQSPGLVDLVAGRIPAVLLDRPVPGAHVDLVTGDNREGGALTARHLVALGHRRLGLIAGPENLASAAERREGFLDAARAAGAETKPEWQASGNFQLLAGYEAMMRILSVPERPTAVACANDLMALGALRALRVAGVKVPEEMALIGYDDIPMASLSDPALTTIVQPAYRLGAAAMERLLARVDGGEEGPPFTTVLPVRLVTRESCGSGKRGLPPWL